MLHADQTFSPPTHGTPEQTHPGSRAHDAAPSSGRFAREPTSDAARDAASALPRPGGDGPVVLCGDGLDLEQVMRIARDGAAVRLDGAPALRSRIEASRQVVLRAVADGEVVYGVTTAFGGMADRHVASEHADALQAGLVRFLHAGSGGRLSEVVVRAAMVIRINSHMRGVSGLRWALIERLALFLNEGVTPEVRELGSIGASGDLVPLAAITGAAIGSAAHRVTWKGKSWSAPAALDALGVEPLPLQAKEGLAMLNGTAVSTAIAMTIVDELRQALRVTLGFHAIAVQALSGSADPFAPFVHAQKPHAGQRAVAESMAAAVHGSRLSTAEGATGSHAGRLVQDRYSLRCLPQFLGPVHDTLGRVAADMCIEANSASDNPLIDVSTGRFHHCGNFLAQYVSTGLDGLRAQAALMAKHVDAQIALLMSPEFSNGLPPSLVATPGRPYDMGLKGLQILGNSIMPLITYLGAPLADRFPTHAEQFNQNINSQSFGSGHLARMQVDLVHRHLACALIACVQAVEIRARQTHPGVSVDGMLAPATRPLYHAVRAVAHADGGERRWLVGEDHEQVLEQMVDALVADLQGGATLVRATSAFTGPLDRG